MVLFVPDTPDPGNHQAAEADRTTGIEPLRGSLRAVPIAFSFFKGCGWTGVSLSLSGVIAASRCSPGIFSWYSSLTLFGDHGVPLGRLSGSGMYLMNAYEVVSLESDHPLRG